MRPRLSLVFLLVLISCSGGIDGGDGVDGRPSIGGARTGGSGGTSGGSPGPLPRWVAAEPLWKWFEIPNTKLSSVDPSPTPPGITGPASKVDAWCGAGLKRNGSVYLIGAAGGHGDYAGNEVNALTLNTETPQWVQLRAPTSTSHIINAAQFYLDLKPSATHTYYATQFINARNRMLVFPSPGMAWASLPAPPNNWPYAQDQGFSFSFNIDTNDWDPPNYVARWPGSGDFTGGLVVKHPITEDVFYSRNYGDGGWWRWNQASNTWTKLRSDGRNLWFAGAAIDPTRNRMLIVGSYSPLAPEVRTLTGAKLAATFGGQGAGVLTVGGYPGVVYDEMNDFYLVFINNNPVSVYRVDASTWTVDQPTISSTVAARKNGIHNSLQYVPELRGVVFVNRHSGNVYFMRTAP